MPCRAPQESMQATPDDEMNAHESERLADRTTGHAEKFADPYWTAKGERRAIVSPLALKTLWFNTGTLCNLACEGCYIESSPRNDRLVYLTLSDVQQFLSETLHKFPSVEEIGFTGGEPFMNPEIIAMLDGALSVGYRTLVLTNAMTPMRRHRHALQALN